MHVYYSLVVNIQQNNLNIKFKSKIYLYFHSTLFTGFTKSIMLLLILSGGAYGYFKLKYEWKQIEYKFSSEEERSEAIANGTFNVGKLQPIDAQYAYVCKYQKPQRSLRTLR